MDFTEAFLSQESGNGPTWHRWGDFPTGDPHGNGRRLTLLCSFSLGCCFPWVPEGWDHQAWLAVQRQYEQCHQRDHEGKSSSAASPSRAALSLQLENAARDAFPHKRDIVWLLRCFSGDGPTIATNLPNCLPPQPPEPWQKELITGLR